MNLSKPLMVMASESKNDTISHFYLQKALHDERMSSSNFSSLTVSTCDSGTEAEACCSLAGFFDKKASILHIKRSNTSFLAHMSLYTTDNNSWFKGGLLSIPDRIKPIIKSRGGPNRYQLLMFSIIIGY